MSKSVAQPLRQSSSLTVPTCQTSRRSNAAALKCHSLKSHSFAECLKFFWSAVRNKDFSPPQKIFWLLVFGTKTVCPTDIWPTTFSQKTIGEQAIDLQAIDQQVFDRRAFDQQVLDRRAFDLQVIDQQAFTNRYLATRQLVNRPLTYRHLANRG